MCDIFDERYSHSTRYIKRRVSDTAAILEVGDEGSETKFTLKPTFWNSVLAGGIAGIVVDFSLYPLDTIKTRLQSDQGFRASGGFRKLYKGIVPVLLCSAPVSALFFCVYNSIVNVIRTEKSSWNPLVYVIAASAAEVLCSTVRVPLEVLKQRKQTSDKHSFVIIKKAIKKEGVLGLYRGFSSTIAREVPFACIQFPLWEYMIDEAIIYQNGAPLTALQTAVCGAIAGGIAGAITTPMDVVKTRIMLAEKDKIISYKPRVYQNFANEVFQERGIRGFFSGLIPRTLWIMLGGFIYFGAYEEVKLLCEQRWCRLKWRFQRFGYWLPGIIKGKLGKIWEQLGCTEFEESRVVSAPSLENHINHQKSDTGFHLFTQLKSEDPGSVVVDSPRESYSKLGDLTDHARDILRSKAPDPGAVSQEHTREYFLPRTLDPGSVTEDEAIDLFRLRTSDSYVPFPDEASETLPPVTRDITTADPDPDALFQEEAGETLVTETSDSDGDSEDKSEDYSSIFFFWRTRKPAPVSKKYTYESPTDN